MKLDHVPRIDGRYWTGIALASVFGTNLGDLYAHDSGLGLIGGLPILLALFIVVYVAERFDRLRHDAYYWLCIIILRTGATNIADYAAGRRGLHIDRLEISAVLGLLLLAFAFIEWRSDRANQTPHALKSLPNTNPLYWTAMLTAGVFGTALGDWVQHAIGQWQAAAVLAVLLAAALLLYTKDVLRTVFGYWLVVAVARTTGTAIGDWLAENEALHIGLLVATLISGAAFALVLIFWRSRPRDTLQAA